MSHTMAKRPTSTQGKNLGKRNELLSKPPSQRAGRVRGQRYYRKVLGLAR